jgi:putative ABC transport system permease protein
MHSLLSDIRYGIRGLLKRPGFTAVVVITLALGIGANTTIFSVVNAVLLRPLPFKDSDRLVRIWESNPSRNWPEFSASVPNYKDWVQQQTVCEHLAAQENSTFNATGNGEPERIPAAAVSANLFPMLGATALLGRTFLPEEEQPGSNRVVVLSNGLWQRRFGGDRNLVGQAIRLNGEVYTVVGVMPSDFEFVGNREIWTPLVLDPASQPWRADRTNHTLSIYGRLKPGVSLAQASAEMSAIAARLEQQYPELNAGWGVRVRTFYDWIVPRELRLSMLVLLAAVGFVLLIACANVANLLLVLAGTRRREMAIRIALGGSRSRLARQLITESLLLASLGGIAGVLVSLWGVATLAHTTVLDIPRLDEARVDGRVLGFTLGVSLLTGLIFGLAPAWRATKLNLTEALKEGSGKGGSEGRQRLRSALVTAEIALALILLVGAGLMMRSFARLQNVELGFAPDKVLTMQINLPPAKYAEGDPRANFFDRLLAQLRTVPGVVDAAAITQPPLTAGNWAMEVNLEGDTSSKDTPQSADARAITTGYFRTMGIPLLQGRDFGEKDRGDSPLTLIVSEKFAQHFWPNENPIGKRFRPGTSNPFGEVVGIVGNVRNLRLEDEGRPAFYFSYGHIGMPGLAVVVRTTANPESQAAVMRANVASIDPELPVFNIRSMDTVVAEASGQQRFQTVLLAVFSGVSLLLAAVGIYGLMSFLVRQRTHEIGIRIALGAKRSQVLKLVVKKGMFLAFWGILAGVAGAWALTRLMTSMLFGVTPTDLVTFAAVCVGLFLVALLACYIPARRATKVNPLEALRYE